MYAVRALSDRTARVSFNLSELTVPLTNIAAKGEKMRNRSAWVTPTLVTLSSGFEAQANKKQDFREGSRGCDETSEGIGCPGSEGELNGPS